ncbi:hypothetical protein ACFL5F_08180 [Planctomycetota bacterium]
MPKPNRGNIVLKMPRSISIYYFVGLVVALVIGGGLVVIAILLPSEEYETAKPILQTIGASLIAGAIVAAAAFAGTLVTQSLQQDEELLRSVREMGIVGYFSKRYLNDEYEKYSKNAHEFDLLGYGLGRFRKDMRHQFEEWARTKTMRILVIHPNSSLTLQRDREENDRIGKISDEALEITADLTDIVYRKKIKVPIIKWYNSIPTVNIMRIDDVMYIGPYFMGKPSGASVTLKLERNTVLFSLFETHFNDIWNEEDLSIDPTFVKRFPGLLRFHRKYSEHKAIFLVGGSCSGKTTAIKIAEANLYAVVDWSDVLLDFFCKEGLELDSRTISDTVRQRGVHFFPHKIMDVLLPQYLKLGDNCRGFVVAGARNIRELCYLSTFFNRSLTKIVRLIATEETRRERYNRREGKAMSLDEFLSFDDSTILWDLESESLGSEIARTVQTIRNDAVSEEDFKEQMDRFFGNP